MNREIRRAFRLAKQAGPYDFLGVSDDVRDELLADWGPNPAPPRLILDVMGVTVIVLPEVPSGTMRLVRGEKGRPLPLPEC